jgi:alpha-L-fucosidase
VSLQHAFNFTGFYERVPAQPTATLRKLYGQLDKATENQLW